MSSMQPTPAIVPKRCRGFNETRGELIWVSKLVPDPPARKVTKWPNRALKHAGRHRQHGATTSFQVQLFRQWPHFYRCRIIDSGWFPDVSTCQRNIGRSGTTALCSFRQFFPASGTTMILPLKVRHSTLPCHRRLQHAIDHSWDDPLILCIFVRSDVNGFDEYFYQYCRHHL